MITRTNYETNMEGEQQGDGGLNATPESGAVDAIRKSLEEMRTRRERREKDLNEGLEELERLERRATEGDEKAFRAAVERQSQITVLQNMLSRLDREIAAAKLAVRTAEEEAEIGLIAARRAELREVAERAGAEYRAGIEELAGVIRATIVRLGPTWETIVAAPREHDDLGRRPAWVQRGSESQKIEVNLKEGSDDVDMWSPAELAIQHAFQMRAIEARRAGKGSRRPPVEGALDGDVVSRAELLREAQEAKARRSPV